MGRIGDWFDGYDRKGWDAYAALQAQRQREREAYVQAMRLRSIEECSECRELRASILAWLDSGDLDDIQYRTRKALLDLLGVVD